MIDWIALTVFTALFAGVTVLGFLAARWRRGDLNQLHEWGLAGRRFGTVVTWFLLGGDLYTAYTFIAVPALVYGAGALGMFSIPLVGIAFPLLFLVMPSLWKLARERGYVTAADLVEGQYGSRTLALAVAFTGILATLPYIALQLVGMQVVLAALGVPGDLPLLIAFVILAGYTYFSGLRAPAMIAIVKDTLIFVTVIAAVVIVPARLGGYGAILAAVPPAKLLLNPQQISSYATLALGSALALFMYPHAMTGLFSSNSANVIRRNAALLPAYTIVLFFMALLGFMALAAGIQPRAPYGAQWVVPGLFLQTFPSWFVGVAFGAIAIGALVPASIMSIAAANLFSRNLYRAYFRREASVAEEARTAKLASLVVKVGALAFIVGVPLQYAINLQLLGGVWIIQILPAVVLGLYLRWLNRWALLAGWAVGMLVGTLMAVSQNFASVFPLSVDGLVVPGYSAFWAFLANLAVCIAISLAILLASRVRDLTSPIRTNLEYTSV
jgi:SSS family solute:Na+ symporter